MRETSETESELLEIWRNAYQGIRPGGLVRKVKKRIGSTSGSALLFWGKSAAATSRGFFDAEGTRFPPTLVISPENAPEEGSEPSGICGKGSVRWIRAEHPLPSMGSFRAGAAVIDFFDTLRRFKVSRLEVFLSGGASSLAWLRPARMSEEALLSELRELYSLPLSIGELNDRRSRLCRLKGGGGARLLKILAPSVRARVWAISDVLPYGPEVIGSGPFWEGKTPHTILADNRTLVDAIADEARAAGETVFHRSSAHLEEWGEWVSRGSRAIQNASAPGVWIWGGEPRVDLEGVSLSQRTRGGRQTQIAAALLAENWDLVLSGRVEILAMSSDGADGRSGAAGAFISAGRLFKGQGGSSSEYGHSRGRSRKMRSSVRDSLRKAVKDFNAASALDALSLLVDASELGPGGFTNVQDTLIIRVK